jgi:hypothetical protein
MAVGRSQGLMVGRNRESRFWGLIL